MNNNIFTWLAIIIVFMIGFVLGYVFWGARQGDHPQTGVIIKGTSSDTLRLGEGSVSIDTVFIYRETK